jgi:cytochrome c551/c552
MDAVVQLVADVVTDRIVPSAELVAAVYAGNVVAYVELVAAVVAVGKGGGDKILAPCQNNTKRQGL